MGPCDKAKAFKILRGIDQKPEAYNTIISNALDGEKS
jgi:hypothetical protein